MTFIAPAGRLRGTLTPPPDKSVSHRAAILGTMAVEPVVIRGFLDAADTSATLAAMRALGALVEERPDEVVVRGTGLREAAPADGPIDVGEAGTLLRLLPGWLAGQEGRSYLLDGAPSARARPIDRILPPLRAMGAVVEPTGGRHAPISIAGRRLHAADCHLPVASAQVKSCVLIAGLVADGTTAVTEPFQSRDHTERLLCGAGVRVERQGARVSIANQDELVLDPIDVPADPSAAAYVIAAGLLVRGSRLLLRDVGVNWTRTAFLRIVERMGGIVLGDLEEHSDVVHSHEPVSDLDVTAGPLIGTRVTPDEIPLAVDELPLVALLACCADGTTVVEGAEELRGKPGDRLGRVAERLRGIGGRIETTPGGFEVEGGGGLAGGHWDATGDPRLALLGAIAGLASRDGVEVLGLDASDGSYPRFLDALAALA